MEHEEFTVAAHAALGTNCRGYIVVHILGDTATMVCDECNAMIYTCPAKEARKAMSQMVETARRKSASSNS